MGAFKLDDWHDLKVLYSWPDILLGNGASCAVSTKFGYKTLYDEAVLSKQSEAVFDRLDTTNFEEVLVSLDVAKTVCRQLHHDHKEVAGLSKEVKLALINVVRKVHVGWSEVSSATCLQDIRAALTDYKAVFSTNYDLILYWAMMKDGPSPQIADMFWNSSHTFDPFDTESDKTLVYWLHGGLHLYRNHYGETVKRVNGGGNDLLTQVLSGPPPLYVAEGDARLKRSAIRQSDYLEHALLTFADREDGLVVVGHSLSDVDDHIVKAIKRSRTRLAYGIYPTSKPQVKFERARIEKALLGVDVKFFDSTTHPLAAPGLKA